MADCLDQGGKTIEVNDILKRVSGKGKGDECIVSVVSSKKGKLICKGDSNNHSCEKYKKTGNASVSAADAARKKIGKQKELKEQKEQRARTEEKAAIAEIRQKRRQLWRDAGSPMWGPGDKDAADARQLARQGDAGAGSRDAASTARTALAAAIKWFEAETQRVVWWATWAEAEERRAAAEHRRAAADVVFYTTDDEGVGRRAEADVAAYAADAGLELRAADTARKYHDDAVAAATAAAADAAAADAVAAADADAADPDEFSADIAADIAAAIDAAATAFAKGVHATAGYAYAAADKRRKAAEARRGEYDEQDPPAGAAADAAAAAADATTAKEQYRALLGESWEEFLEEGQRRAEEEQRVGLVGRVGVTTYAFPHDGGGGSKKTKRRNSKRKKNTKRRNKSRNKRKKKNTKRR